MAPSEYLERIDPKSGKVVVGAIDPRELIRGGRGDGRCFRYKSHGVRAAEAARVAQDLRAQAAAALERSEAAGLAVLITGGTGFLGKEILRQAARERRIAQVIVLIRPKPIREKSTGRVIEVHAPERRGQALLAELRLAADECAKFRFVAGDVEQPGLGIAGDVADSLRGEITHVIHSAANVAFDDTYQRSFRANVIAARNALQFSRWLQAAPHGRFVAHLAVGTSYLHGRCGARPVHEESLAFPEGCFNNYYELTKAMAALETERHVLRHGLRAVELCPAIVIGEQRTGNNRGDTKVVNAPVNFLGRTRNRLDERGGVLAALAARLAMRFPADADAELNLVTVDWVARGVLAALTRPQSVGRRIHLSSGARINAREMAALLSEELGTEVRLLSPVAHRAIALPLACGLLKAFGREKSAQRLHRLGSVFAGYSESGQPIHAVANDVAILGMPAERPCMVEALRMLCRHNEWVQDYGKVRDAEEISRREAAWAALIERVEARAGRRAGRIPASEFRTMLAGQLGVLGHSVAEGARARAAVAPI